MTSVPGPAATGTAADADRGSDLPAGRPRWASWTAGFLLIFGLLAAWSLATPKYAAPDEPAHAYRAASLVRGELLGRDVSRDGDPSVRVSVPRTLTAYNQNCFAFRQRVTAACMPAWTDHPGTVQTNTYTGRYPPLYYLAVGLPSLLTTGGSVLLWMRLAGDLVNALFLTAGFRMLARTARPWWAIFGGAVAVTPMVLFIASVVNPSGLELCSAFALWGSMLMWVRAGEGAPVRAAVVWSTVSAVVFESTRGLSPVFLVATVAAIAVVAGRRRIRQLVRLRETWVAGAVAGGFGVLALAWVLLAGALRLARVGAVPADVTTSAIIHAALFKNRQFPPFVGSFGWLDTPVPWWVDDVWKVAVVCLVVGVIAVRAWRPLLVMGLLVIGTVVIPTIGDVLQARSIGMVSQARYILPLAIGAAIVAGVSITWRGRWARLAAAVGLVCLGIGQLGGFLLALRRYRFGLGSAVPTPAEWAPPLGATTLIVVFVAALLGLQVWFWTLTRSIPKEIAVDAGGRPSPAVH